ncbi:anti-sigma factor [Demequina pelophila]|uniref:anti-sigma factor n=1 Tax=Demequina pelophila TaxID=1638984 RepID=UPI00078584E8|nr:anti-sigma factor [Demequina pelophila]
MRHCDDEVLAALAFGDPVGAEDSAHVESCAACRAEVAELRAFQEVLVEAGAEGPLAAPPARVWEGIQAELAQDEATGRRPEAILRAEPVSLAERRARREPRHLFKPWIVGAAAAAGVVVGGVGVGLVMAGGDSSPQQAVVAQAGLADLATERSVGEARVERRDDGTEVLVIETEYAPAEGGALEVWLIEPEIVGMVSLGFLTADAQEFEIPAGYDVAAFPIVDISVEPSDGDPTHSGDSVTRGVLES